MDAHVVMLGTVSPAAASYDETLQTLLYAERLQRLRSTLSYFCIHFFASTFLPPYLPTSLPSLPVPRFNPCLPPLGAARRVP